MGNATRDGVSEKPAPGPACRKRDALAGREPKLANLAAEVEPLVRAGREEAMKLENPKERMGMMFLVAAACEAVGGDPQPILKGAYEGADAVGNPFLSAELLLCIAHAYKETGQDPLPVMARALEKVEQEAECAKKREALAGIAFSYAKLSEPARAEAAADKISDPGFREAVKRAICELPF
ncbi:MAG: hypothetical protein WC350_04285 [Candidatus Micrarchaeia archaeon]|jgi:hypothetical protein